MSRRCMITGKAPKSGNNVSHALNRTRRKFFPNIRDASLYSEALGKWVQIKVSASGLRTVEHKGGFDAFIVKTAKTKLDPALREYKDMITKAQAEKVS